MENLFKRIYRMSIISSLLFLVFGLFLVFQTDSVIKTVSIFIGCLLVIIGIFPIVNYFRYKAESFFSSIGLMYGIFSVVAGIIIIINKDLLATLIPVLTGVWMIINSVNKIQISMQLRDNKYESWLVTFIFAIVILIGGVLLITNPFKGAVLVTRTIGILIIVYVLFDLADTIFIKVKTKEIKNKIRDVTPEE